MVHEPNIGGQRSLVRRSPYNISHACDHSLPSSTSRVPNWEIDERFAWSKLGAQDEIGVIPIPIQRGQSNRDDNYRLS